MKFSKAKMIERIKKEGRENLIDEQTLAIMDDLDGQEASTSCWRRRVYMEPVMWVVGKSGTGNYVNEADCEE